MEPTYREGALIFIRSYELLFRNPERGDIVALIDNNGYRVVKRVVLGPGDWNDITPGKPRQLGPREYVVIGDNTNNSMDSREYGPVQLDQILGIVK